MNINYFFSFRIKNIDMTNLLTNKLLDELIKHNRLYRLTKTQLSYRSFTDGKSFIILIIRF